MATTGATSLLQVGVLAARHVRAGPSCLALQRRARATRRLATQQQQSVACFSTSRLRLAKDDEAEGSGKTTLQEDELDDDDWANEFLGGAVEAQQEAESGAGTSEAVRTSASAPATSAERIDMAAFFAEQEQVVVTKRADGSTHRIHVLAPTLTPLADSSSATKVERLLAESDRLVDKAKRGKRAPQQRVRTGAFGQSEALPDDPSIPVTSVARKRFDAARASLLKSFNAKQLRSVLKAAKLPLPKPGRYTQLLGGVTRQGGWPTKPEMVLALLEQRYGLEDPTEDEMRQQRANEEAEALAAAAESGERYEPPPPEPKIEREIPLPRAHVWLWVVHAGVRGLQRWAKQADKEVEAYIAQLDDGNVGIVTASLKEADAEEAKEWILQWSSTITSTVLASSEVGLSERFVRVISDLSGAFVEPQPSTANESSEIVVHALGGSRAPQRAAALLRMHDVEASHATQRQLLIYAELSDAELDDAPPSLLDGIDEEGPAAYSMIPSAAVEPTSWLSDLDADSLAYRVTRERKPWQLSETSTSRCLLRPGVAETLDDAFALLDPPSALSSNWQNSTRQYTAHFGHLLFSGHYTSSSPHAHTPLPLSWPITRALEAFEEAELQTPTFCPAVPPQGLALLEYMRKRETARVKSSPPPLGLGTLKREIPSEVARFSYALRKERENARLVVEIKVPGSQSAEEDEQMQSRAGGMAVQSKLEPSKVEDRSLDLLSLLDDVDVYKTEKAVAEAEHTASAAADAADAEQESDSKSLLASVESELEAESDSAPVAESEVDTGFKAWWEISGEADMLVPDSPIDVRVSSSRVLKLTSEELHSVREQLTPFMEAWQEYEAKARERLERVSELGATPAGKHDAPILVPLVSKAGPTAPTSLALPTSAVLDLEDSARISRTTFTFGTAPAVPIKLDLEDIWASVLDDLDEPAVGTQGETPEDGVANCGFEPTLVLEEAVREGEEDMRASMALQWRPVDQAEGGAAEGGEKLLEWETAVKHLRRLLDTPYKTLKGRSFSS